MRRYTRFLLPAIFCFFATGAQALSNISGPPSGDGPLVVNIGFLLSNINAIEEEDETFDFEGVLSMHWKDSRLAFDPSETGYDQLFYQGNYQFSEVFNGWWPQIFLANEAGRYESEGVMLRVTPDGDVYYTEEIDGIAKSSLQLARYPFDKQELQLIFEVLGFSKNQVIMSADPGASGIWDDDHHQVIVPQWRKPHFSSEIVEYSPTYLNGRDTHVTAYKVQINIDRDYWYTLRLVALPVMVFVMLSWSVFWMERSSLGDRMDISFIGILTVVAYQIMSSESLPKISYITVLMSFMIISFLMMCASVTVNLRVAALDNSGRSLEGDRMDRICRIVFPIAYILITSGVGIFIYLKG
jgi:hypothetical protein